MRDLTRGGLASSLVEISRTAELQIDLDENAIPVQDEVRGACEILGLDPIYVANEGRFIAFVEPGNADAALALLQEHDMCSNACRIGEVVQTGRAEVVLKSQIGAKRIVDMMSGEQLPRIC